MSNCEVCKSTIYETIGDHHAFYIEFGEVVHTDIEFRSCDCGKYRSFGMDACNTINRNVDKIIKTYLGYLPISQFVSKKEALRLLGTDKNGKVYKKLPHKFPTLEIGENVFVNINSVDLFLRTGDGRFNLLAELSKHSITNSMICEYNIKQPMRI